MTLQALFSSYRDGDLTWDELRAALIAFPYETPARVKKRASSPSAHWVDVENASFHDAETWDEVRHARNFGWITNEQYLDVARALAPVTAGAQPLEMQ